MHTTMTSLIKAAQSFYRLSQDQFQAVKSAAENALRARVADAELASIKSVSVIGKEVKITVTLNPKEGAVLPNRTDLQGIMQFAIGKIDPTLTVQVLIDMSSESLLGATASTKGKKKTALEDPLAPIRNAINSTMAANVSPQVAEVQSVMWIIQKQTVQVEVLLHPDKGTPPSRSALEALIAEAIKKVNPAIQFSLVYNISSEGKVASFRAKLRAKLAQDATESVKSTISGALAGIPGSKLVSLTVSGTNVAASIEVPEKHSFTASQLGDTLTRAIQSVLPGGKVVTTLTFNTAKTASRTKSAQDAKLSAEQAVISALSSLKDMTLKSFIYQPETRHVLVEVAKPMGSQVSAQQISTFLTGKLQGVAPGFSAIATTTTVS